MAFVFGENHSSFQEEFCLDLNTFQLDDIQISIYYRKFLKMFVYNVYGEKWILPCDDEQIYIQRWKFSCHKSGNTATI